MAHSFAHFFASGMEESISPFLTPRSRRWGKMLPLKAAFFAAVCWVGAVVYAPLAPLFLLFTYFFAGMPALIDAVEDVLSWDIEIDVLMTLAAFLAIPLGCAHEGGLLLVLFALSGAMEGAVRERAKGALQSLQSLAPPMATVVLGGGVHRQRGLADVAVGDVVFVQAGERVPLDGVVQEGASLVDLFHLTGERVPVTRAVGDGVPAGARAVDGSLQVAVTHVKADSTLERIIRLVTEAHEAKPRFQRWLDKVSSGYAKGVILVSFGLALVLPLITSLSYFGVEGSIYRALAFLIAASPCALIIAVPTAYLSAISACARKGIVLKGGVTLDALAACDVLALDKTGTLTEGKLQLVEPVVDQEVLAVAHGLERHSSHPIARAVVEYAESRGIAAAEIRGFRNVPGYGSDGEGVWFGNRAFVLPKLTPEVREEVEGELKASEERGEVCALLLVRETPYLFRFTDAPRPRMRETLTTLRALYEWDVVMLTGDHERSAQVIARQVGVETFYAHLTPEEKLRHVERLAEGASLAMVGDGINDAPALARAAVGISMGKVGSDAAVEASDVVLLHDRLDRLPWLVGKAKATVRIVKQNLVLAAGVICLASLPALFGLIPLWLAVVLHEGGTLLVGLNALRLLKR